MAPTPATLRAAFAALAAALALAAAPAAGAAVDVQHAGATATETAGTSNNDGILQPGETFALDERMRNTEPFGLNQVHGSLAYHRGRGTPVVTLAETEADYPNLAAGALGENLTPYRGQIAAGAECGQGFDMRLDMTSSGGPDQVPFRFSTGVAGPLVSHDSVDVPQFIADNSTVESNLQVDEAGRVKDVEVRIGDITHTATGDLRLEIVAPDGTTVLLAERKGTGATNFEQHDVLGLGERNRSMRRRRPSTASIAPSNPFRTSSARRSRGRGSSACPTRLGTDTGTLNAWGLDLRPALCDGSPWPASPPTPTRCSRGTRRSSTPRAPWTPTA